MAASPFDLSADHRALAGILPIDSEYDVYSLHEFEFA
jgi:hypothetical protein